MNYTVEIHRFKRHLKAEEKSAATVETHRTLGGWIAHIVGFLLCTLFLPGFIVNTTLLISSLLYPDIPPSFMGYTPLVVESDSMSPFFQQDDLVIIRNSKDNADYETGTVTELNVSGFKTDNVTNMGAMFMNCRKLITIYVDSGWSTAKVTASTNMFTGSTNLKGGAGTPYNSSKTNKAYARIDGGPDSETPGYFTDIKDKPTA